MRNIFILLVLVMCALPALLMPITGKSPLGANEPPVIEPKILVGDAINKNVLSDFSEYIGKHFAFRQELITVNSAISAEIFNVSQVEDVILGTKGWLFYTETLDDFLHKDTLSNSEINKIAVTLQKIEKHCNDKGINFLLAIAPNKNSIYPQYMPYLGEVKGKSNNWDNLLIELEQRKISYINLFDRFKMEEEVLYHKLDTHWNNMGAAIACDEILKAIEHNEERFQEREYAESSDFEGDLYKMLYPKGNKKDSDLKLLEEFSFIPDEPITSPDQFEIKTSNPDKEGSVLVFRDSFGNALYPFIAESFNKAVFTRVYSLDLLEEDDVDTLIIVMAERNLAQFDRFFSL